MMRALVAAITIAAFIGSLNMALTAPLRLPPTPPDSKAIKERVVAIPLGSYVQVRLLDKQKIKGRLGAVNDEGFQLQTVKDGKVTEMKIAFSSVKSVEQKDKPMGTAGKVTLWSLAGFGITLLVWGIVCASMGGCGG